MTFHRDLRVYLEAHPTFARERQLDEQALRDHVLARLRSLEREEAPEKLAALHEEWVTPLRWFVRYLERLPVSTAPTDPAEALRFATQVLDVAIGHPEAAGSLIDRLELQRILREYRGQPGLETYALENHLLAEVAPGQLQLTQLGHTFLRLRGRDAIRWLVTTETLQSLGSGDLWHLARETLLEAMTPSGTGPFHPVALSRAIEFGVLSPLHLELEPEAAPIRYAVPDAMRELITAVLEHGSWHTAIRALLEDERAAALSKVVSTTAAVDATVEQTRLITHDVRNALIPARHHLDVLLGSEVGGEAHFRAESARRGVVRVLHFVEQLVATAELISEPLTSRDLAELAEDALSRIEGSERVVIAAGEPLQLRVPQHRMAIAVSDLIRNALQATPPPAPIRLSWQSAPQEVRIQVDDGGPGVRLEDRERIFDDGFSTRPGGSGFGLAFTRRFIESSLRGKVWCEDSDLGGARFVVAIPLEHTA